MILSLSCGNCLLAKALTVKLISLLHNDFRVSGYMMVDKLVVPRRKIKKNWYVGLNSDPVDRSHPDVDDDQIVLAAEKAKSMSRKSHPHSNKLF